MLCLHRYCTHRMGRALSTLIGPEVLAVRPNNSEGMGEEGGQESVVVPSLSSSHPHSPLTPPLHPHSLHSAPRRRGVPRKIKRRPSLISLLFHTMFALWDHSQLMLELIVALFFLEFESDVGVNNLHKSLSTDLHPESKSDYWWHWIMCISV